MNDPLLPFAERRGAAVLDGGLATELERRGCSIDDTLWSAAALIEAPELVTQVHRDYLDAGADIITTATYQATLQGLAARGLSAEQAARVLLSGVDLALAVRDAFWERRSSNARLRPLVAASIGSYGAFLADGSEYRGTYRLDRDALIDWHRPRIRLLQGSGADLLAFETIPSLVETEAIVAVLSERGGTPAWISFQARDTSRLADGSPVEVAAAIAMGCSPVLAVGVNCVPPGNLAPLLARLGGLGKPLVAYPNRGGIWNRATRTWSDPAAPIPIETLAPQWRDRGARVIGGCCRTTPADIRAIARALDRGNAP